MDNKTLDANESKTVEKVKKNNNKKKATKRKPPVKKARLTDQQKKFVELFLATGNKARSYQQAGYKTISIEASSANAIRLLKRDKVSEYYEKRLKELQDKQHANVDEVMLFLSQSMRGNIKDAFDLDASLQDRLRAAELLGKRFKMFTDKVEVKGSLPVVISGDDKLEELEDDENGES